MNVVIVEDEHLLALELEELLLDLAPGITIAAKLGSVAEAVDWFKHNRCDLAFMDIQLNDGLSFDILKRVPSHYPIIFTTAYDQYAIQAFEHNSISYLLKPIDPVKLEQALNKFQQTVAHQGEDLSQLLKYLKQCTTEPQYTTRFILSLGKVQRPVNADQIAYFMADNKYLFAITFEGKKYFCDHTLTDLEQKIDPRQFYRVNRRYMVNINAIKELLSYSKSRLKIKLTPETDEEVIISNAKSNEFRTWLSK